MENKIIDGKELVNMKFIKTEDGLLKEYKPQGRFIPKYDECYYFIGDGGCVSCTVNKEFNTDNYRINHMLLFKNEKEVEDYKWFLEKLDLYKTDFSNKNWKNENICKYYITYDFDSDKLGTYCNSSIKSDRNYFTKENIDKFIEVVGEDRIKKYMFDIWE